VFTVNTYLGIDIGTTNVKALLCDSSGRSLATASRGYPTRHLNATWVEQDPEDWWTAARDAVGEIAEAVSLESVSAVAFSAQAPTLIAVDEQSRALRPAMIWMDRRSEAQCDELRTTFGDTDYTRRAGNRIDPFYVGPKIMWLRANEPEILARTAAFVQIPGFMACRLTGNLSLDETHASILGLGCPSEWDQDLLEIAGIDSGKLPHPVGSHAIVGYTIDGALPGVRAGVPVAAGTVDSAAAALEVELASHEALLMTGTSSVLVMPRPDPQPSREFISMASPEGGWYDLAAMVSSGASVEWFRGILGVELSGLLARAAESPPGARGLMFLPYLAGERSPWWDTDARGAFVGLTANHGLPDLVRAVLEGTAMALRQNLVVAASLGHDIRRLAISGAPARNSFWNQILADVAALPLVHYEASGGSAFGCCRLAARSIGDEVPVPGGVPNEFHPAAANRVIYDDLFATYDQLYPALRDISRGLARHSGD
jgi:xylulokinase